MLTQICCLPVLFKRYRFHVDDNTNSFGILQFSVSKTIIEVCDAIVKTRDLRFIHLKIFQNYLVRLMEPHTANHIVRDGTHIPFKRLTGISQDYFSYTVIVSL